MRHCSLLAALLLAGCTALPSTETAQAPPPPAAFSSLQWLYGSGEGAVASVQAYRMLHDFVLAGLKARPQDSVVLAQGATLANPSFVPCGDKPKAVVFDIDETVLQNLGFQYERDVQGRGYEVPVWDRWEKAAAHVAPMPGAREAILDLKAKGVVVVFNSNRAEANAAATAKVLRDAGFGDAIPGDTLQLMGADGSGKDKRRAAVAAKYCVIAMAGDQLGDFSDLFKAGLFARQPDRRETAVSAPVSRLWGNGWFVLSNPVYGSGLTGTRDEIFAPDARWVDPGQQ